ncbi:hypothetical protein [Actinomadura rayongensis]|uniref:Protein kinase domain-containing protein n=1 Tax=Actinomadura rayongensis TaxID=1429076 RepID=A0A6I4W870_9ACTN|nr:hypothetical protein [Actinomadura rayongensis]MXQ65828.1 hypothetical protein [Actinomadura rayongensis]
MRTERVPLWTPSGDRVVFDLALEAAAVGGARYTAHFGTVAGPDGRPVDCLYKVAHGLSGRRALDAELGVFGAFRMGGLRADQFADLLGHDLDAEDGRARLLQTRRGRPVDARRLPLRDQQLWHPVRDLFTALRLLADNGYAHRNITPSTVLFDGTRLQIADLTEAYGQPSDDDLARDVSAAAALLHWLASGGPSALAPDGDHTQRAKELHWLTSFHPDLAVVLRPVYEGADVTAAALLERMTAWPRPTPASAPGPAPAPVQPQGAVAAPGEPGTARDSADPDHVGTDRVKYLPPSGGTQPNPRPQRPPQPREQPPERPPAQPADDELVAGEEFDRSWTGPKPAVPRGSGPQPRPDVPGPATSGPPPPQNRQPQQYGQQPAQQYGQPAQQYGQPAQQYGQPAQQYGQPAPGRPFLPPDFPFSKNEDGNRRLHPAVLWPALFVVLVLVLLVVLP